MRFLTLLAALAIVAGCGSREVLQPHSAANPAKINFAGYWTLNEDPVTTARRLNQAIRKMAGIRYDVFRPRQPGAEQRRTRSASGGLVHVFFEDGESLKITQTPSAIFISFDRAVVEEFRFGENREISLGEVTAQRVSGWDGPAYVVETLDRNGMKLTERYLLSGDRQTLIRQITFRSKQQQEMTVVETFSRRPGAA